MSKKPAGRRFPLIASLSGQSSCFHLHASGQRMAAIVQDHRSAYGMIMEPSRTNIPLHGDNTEAVTAIATSLYDASFVAIGTQHGSVQVYSIDADGTNCDLWIDTLVTTADKAIVGLEFVPPPPSSKTAASFTSSLVALTRDGNLIALDVFSSAATADNNANETTGLLSSRHSSENQHGSFRIQASIKLVDFVAGQSEQPTGAITVLDDHEESPLVVLGMSGGTLLVLGRTFDSDGYTWDCVKQLSLPSSILSLALSTHAANSVSKHSMLAAGLEDGEVALLDAARGSSDADQGPPYSPFHFLGAHHDDGVPASRLSFHWSHANDSGCHQLHLAIASGSLLRIANMSTFEVFYAYRATSRIRDISFCPDGLERVLVARDDNITECVTWSPWRFIYGESTFQKLHSRFKPTTTTVSNRNSQASSITSAQAKFASFFQHHPVTSMSFSGDSNSLAVSCGNDVILCDSSTWLPVAETTTDTSFDKIQIKNDEMVGQVVYSPDSSILAITTALTSNGSGCRLVLYAQSEKGDGTSEWKVRETRSVSSKVEPSIAFSPTSQHLVVTENHKFTVFAVGEAKSSIDTVTKTLRSSAEASPSISCALFSPDGDTLAVPFASTVVFFTCSDFNEESRLEMPGGGDVASLSFASNSTTLAVSTSNGTIYIAKKNVILHHWKIKKELKYQGTAPRLLFSPDISSSFMAVLDGSEKCSIYGTDSFEVIQQIPCSETCKLTSAAFDPSGTILAIGGETKSLRSNAGGMVLIVRVGELLSSSFFCLETHSADPTRVCQKLSSLSAVERAQILFHRSETEESAAHGHFPLERKISSGVASRKERDSKESLGSSVMRTERSSEAVMVCLKAILIQFPQTAFVGCSGHGNMFSALLERDNPRLLKLLFYSALVNCRSFPYLAMNEEMRNGTVTRALVDSCDAFPEVVLDVVNSMVLWPATLYNPGSTEWRVPGGNPVYSMGDAPELYRLYDETSNKTKGGLMARPMVLPTPDISTLSFLSALTTDCDYRVFASEKLGVVLNDLWEAHIKWIFIVDFLLYVVFCACWTSLVTTTNVCDRGKTPEEEALDRRSMSLMLVVFLINLLLIIKGFRKVKSASDWYKPQSIVSNLADRAESAEQIAVDFARQLWLNPVKALWYGLLYFTINERMHNFWDMCDILNYWMVNVTLVLALLRSNATTGCAVVTTFLILLEMLGYLRGFERCGWLLTVLNQNFQDSKGFLVVILTILLGFSVMFQILLGPFDADYDTHSRSFFSIFEMGILGFVDPSQFQGIQSPALTMILLFVLILVVYIVALNGYIALLGGSYAQVAKVQDASKRYQQATLIVGYLKVISKGWRQRIMAERRYLFALLPVVDDDTIPTKQDTAS